MTIRNIFALICLLASSVFLAMPSLAQEEKKKEGVAVEQPTEEKKKEAVALEQPAPPSSVVAAMPAIPAAEAKIDPRTYVIGPEDILLVRVWREPELSGQVVVRPDGKITMQLLNELQAAGQTPEVLSNTIKEGLAAKYMNKPEVTVTVVQVNSKKYFIQGEVTRPGAYPLLIPTTVLEALVNAGGFRDFADQKGIFVMRRGQRFKFNYRDVIKGKKMEQNIVLEPGDHLIVP